ncbi:MAG: M24 family metallopeptidase [Longimicrobiales bacterium]
MLRRSTTSPVHRSTDRGLPTAASFVLLLAAVVMAGLLPASALAQARDYDSAHPFGTLREQAKLQQAWLEERLEVNLPKLMRNHDVDMWVVTMREYNEDPVFKALVSPTTFAARRRTIYMFHDRGPELGVERIALGGTSQGGAYEAVRATAVAADGQSAELWGKDQWDLFARMVAERDPSRIAVNISHDHNFSDGLTTGEWEQMEASLGSDLAGRVVREPLLAIDYLAMRVPGMTPTYRRMQSIVHEIIGTAFSEVVIVPGQTTTADVVWWMRQRVHDLGLGTWFQPSVSVQRQGVDLSGETAPVIQRGDVLHCDFGLVALGMSTDTQHMAYVLREGETKAPAGLEAALANANRLQDILLEETKVGRSGNEILASVLETMRAEGLNGTMYTHPIGDHGHGAGPLIGLWDYQTGVPGRGDPLVIPSMWFSTELQVTTPVDEWGGQPVRMALEEEAEVTAEGEMRWMLRRQTELHLVH